MPMVTSIPFLNPAATASVLGLTKSPATLAWLEMYNPNAVPCFLQIFDARQGDVNLGTTTPILSLFIPASGAQDKMWGHPPRFFTSISYAITTTSTGSGAPAVGCVVQGGITGGVPE